MFKLNIISEYASEKFKKGDLYTCATNRRELNILHAETCCPMRDDNAQFIKVSVISPKIRELLDQEIDR